MKVMRRSGIGNGIPLLIEEGWREAPGWSVMKHGFGMTTPSALSKVASQHFPDAQPPLLFKEENTHAA